jgi:hypothetical protein
MPVLILNKCLESFEEIVLLRTIKVYFIYNNQFMK